MRADFTETRAIMGRNHCDRADFSATGHPLRAPGPLRVFLRQQAEASLARHGITEPVTWEPPRHRDSIAGAARVLYDGRDGALRQQITKTPM
jgi:hypothetical protein